MEVQPAKSVRIFLSGGDRFSKNMRMHEVENAVAVLESTGDACQGVGLTRQRSPSHHRIARQEVHE